LREGRGTRSNGHEAGVDTQRRGGHAYTWAGKGRLGNGMILSLELEGNGVSGLSGDIGRLENKPIVGTDLDQDIGSIDNSREKESGCDDGEAHCEFNGRLGG